MSRVLSIRLPLAVVALMIGSGALQANNKLALTYSSTSLWCSTLQGVGPSITVTVKPVTTITTGSITVAIQGTPGGGLVVTPPQTTSLSTSNQAAGLVYTVALATNCTGVVNGGTPTFYFTQGGTQDVQFSGVTTTKYTTELLLTQGGNPLTNLPLSCSTVTGPPSPVSVVVKPAVPLTSLQTIAVTIPNASTLAGYGIVVTAPQTPTLTFGNQTTGLTYTVGLTNGCVGVTNGGTSFNFSAGGTSDASLTVTETLSAGTSGLTVSASTVTVNCVWTTGPVYTPGAAQSITVTSATPGGIPFTVTNSGLPTGVTVTPNATTGGTAGATAIQYSFVAASPCGNGAVGSSVSGSFVLHNSPAADKTVTVVLQVTNATPLLAAPGTSSLTYTKGTGTPSTAPVRITSNALPTAFFTVDTTSLPIWLTVDSVSGTVPKTLNFSTTSICDSLAPGTYTGGVRLQVATYGALTVNFSLFITNPAPKLTIAQGPSQSFTWVMNQGLPSAYITLVSSDSPIQYTLTSGGVLAPIVSSALQSGLAYNFGTEIPVSFSPTAFGSAQPASTLTGTLTVTWGNPAQTTVETFQVTVQSPNPTLISISPASVPTASAGQQFTVVLNGTGFVNSADPLQKTKVGVVSGGVLVQDTNISSSVNSSGSQIALIITAAAGDANLNFTAGGQVTIGVCNPQGVGCTTAAAVVPFSISSGPVVQAVTSASSYQEVAPGATQSIAPYDMISIFGTNFCASSAPQCASNQILTGVLDSNLVYQNWLAQDAVGPTQRKLTVTFCPNGQLTGCTNAPLLFATNSQINALVPGGLSSGSPIDIYVNYGYGTGATMATSTVTTVNVIATNPGVFAIGADGQGPGAILASNWTLIGSSNPAGMRSTGTDSDVIQIYMTGLGVPDSAALNSSPAGSSTPPTDCLNPSEYLNTLNAQPGASYTALDGAVIQSALLYSGKMAPCMTSLPTVSIGNVAASLSSPIGYAGWVEDSVAGLYQVNAKLPASGAGPFTDANGNTVNTITAVTELPVQVSFGGHQSQAGVTVWVAPRLKVLPPSGGGLTGKVGVAWSATNNAVVASEGTGPFLYSVTSGVLPTGLTLVASGTNAGQITGIPAAGTSGSSVITVTATDSENVPLTGTTTFTLTVAGGLVMASSAANYTSTVVTNNSTPTLTAISATGGAFPYTFAWDTGFTPPSGMSLVPGTGGSTGVNASVTITNQTPAGVYTVKVKATDANGWTGTITFPVTLNLVVSAASGSAGLTGTSPNFSGDSQNGPYTINLTSVGGSAYTYTTPAQTGFNISTNTLNITSTTPGSYTVVVTSTQTSPAATGSITLTIVLLPHLTVTSSSSMNGISPNWTGNAGSSYTITLGTTGGTTYTYSMTAQSGFTLSTNTLSIASSVPAGQYSVAITSRDSGSAATGLITLNITLLPVLTVSVASTSGGLSGTSPNYTGTIVGGGGYATITLSTTGGTGYTYTMPTQSGFSLSTGGVLTISSTTANSYTFLITSHDTGSGATAAFNLYLQLTLPTLGITSSSTDMTGTSPNWSGTATNEPLHVQVTASGGTSYTYSTTPTQAGLSLNTSTGLLTITAGTTGSPYTVVVTATDASTASTQISLSITLN